MPNFTLEQAIALGREHHRKGELQQAEAVYRQILQQQPDQPEALFLLAGIAQAVGKVGPGIELLKRAVQLAPQEARYRANLGQMLWRSGKLDEAERFLRESISIAPNQPETHHELAHVLMDLGRWDESAAEYRQSIALAPGWFLPHNNLAVALQGMGHEEEAVAQFRRAIQIQPQVADTHANLANALLLTGQVASAIASSREAIRLNPRLALAQSNLLYALHFDESVGRQELLDEHRRWAKAHAEPPAAEKHKPEIDRRPGRRLRIGYVSPDLRDHPVGRFLLPVLANHDRKRFEIHIFSDVAAEDDVTKELRQHSDYWHRIRGRNDAIVAKTIADERIDILFDLTGHSGANRLRAFARRPAPIQATWLGYPDTTGMPAMDYRFTDAHADPIDAGDAFCTEKLICLPGGFLCYQPPDDVPDVSPPPFEQRGHVTFGSFNNLAKISQRAVMLWSRVMQSVPDAKLIIKSRALADEATRSRLCDRFVAAGVDAERLDIRGKEPTHASHLGAYGDVDIALDTFPYNGTMTTCEALVMGVPVIALAGEAHAARVGVSLLTHAGMDKWIAADEEAFVAITQKLAGDREKLREHRRALRQRLLGSPLCDAAGFTREFESALETMWHRSLEKAGV